MFRAVCVITNAYPDFEGSYHGVFIRRLAVDLAGYGWRSHILCPRVYPESPSFESFDTHSVRRVGFFSARKLLIEYERVPWFRLSALLANSLRLAVGAVRSERCELIHAHWAFPSGLIGLAASRLTRRPLLLTVHGSDQRLAAERGGAAARAFGLAARGAARVISVSGPITDYLLRIGAPAERISTRPLGVDDRVFNSSVAPDPSLAGSFSAVSTRNLLPLYRLEDFLRAAAAVRDRLPGLRLVLAGEGAGRPALESLGHSLGLEDCLAFSGRLSPDRLAALLAAARVYVSTSPAEGTSVSLLEALALGCLPVVADIPSNRAWVAHGDNGLLFPPGDSAALAGCLLRASGDNELRKRARDRGPLLVSELGLWSGQVRLNDSLYRELAGR